MGFFSKLFEKKQCSVCGGEIGLLGNRKLSDGNCCKTCAKKLSPWFEDRRESTVEQIKEQLAYREENKRKLADFRVSQIIGEYYKMYIEVENGIPTRFFVTTADDYMDANPDIISFRDLMSCVVDIDEEEREMKKEDSNGNKVSYSPPQFETDYDFYIKMQVSGNPYFDDLRFQLNSNTVTLATRSGASGSFLGLQLTSAPVDISQPREKERHQKYKVMCEQIEQIVQLSRQQPQAAAPVAEPESVAPAAPVGPKFCQSCGAPADGGKFCQSCGAPF